MPQTGLKNKKKRQLRAKRRELVKKILITGASGLLGSNLAFKWRDQYKILGLYNSHPFTMPGIETQKIDLLSREAVGRTIREFQPEIIVHCAAIADIDLCETDRDLAHHVNVVATKALAEEINDLSVKLVYISTDTVYAPKEGLLSEKDPVQPPNYYGQTKYKGEQEALKRRNSLVVRTNFFGWNVQDKLSLGEWVIAELKKGKTIQGFRDTMFSSIYTFELARLLALAIQKDLNGVYNLSSCNSLSKYDFIMAIADVLGLDSKLVQPISVEEFPFKARRAKNMSLNVRKLARDLKIKIPSIETSIDLFLKDYQNGLPQIFKPQGISLDTVSEDVYPHLNFIPYGRQSLDSEDIAAVEEVLRSQYLTQGPKIKEFEGALCERTGAKFCAAVNSGTAALHLACLAAEIGEGDEVITSPNTFVASANCIAFCGGKPVFADIDPQTYTISPEEVRKKISSKTKAVLPVDFAGQSCNLVALREIVDAARRKYGHKIYIIEDAAHAFGSKYKGKPVGSCLYNDMTIFSFHPVKHITTGEGGAISTNDENLYRRIKLFGSHGIANAKEEFIYPEQAHTPSRAEREEDLNPWYYEQLYLGYNYRITDIQCALGLSQLKKLERFRRRRREIVNRYNAAFKDGDGLTVPFEHPDGETNFHLYVLLVDFTKIETSRAQVIYGLRDKGIHTQVHYIPVTWQPFYRQNFGTQKGDCPQAEGYYEKCLSLPLHPAMSDRDVDFIIQEVLRVTRNSQEKKIVYLT